MKLFIWSEFNISYVWPGLAFAIADDEAEAKKLVVKNRGFGEKVHEVKWGKVEVYPLTNKIARAVSGGE
jgi:hypothetical protein